MTKIVNVYIVYELNTWPKNPTNNFKFKNCLFGATNVVKNSDKLKYIYSGYGKTFDSGSSWSFDNDFARNIKNNFLILSEGPTFGINGSFGSPEKHFDINFSKVSTKFCLNLHYNHDNSYLFVNGKNL